VDQNLSLDTGDGDTDGLSAVHEDLSSEIVIYHLLCQSFVSSSLSFFSVNINYTSQSSPFYTSRLREFLSRLASRNHLWRNFDGMG
jgi:hypothetical protein